MTRSMGYEPKGFAVLFSFFHALRKLESCLDCLIILSSILLLNPPTHSIPGKNRSLFSTLSGVMRHYVVVLPLRPAQHKYTLVAWPVG